MDFDNDADWLRLQLEADAAIAVDQLVRAGTAACDEYLATVNYAARLQRLQTLEARA